MTTKRIKSSRQQARFEEPHADKSTHTDAQEDFVRVFVSHSVSIIMRNQRIAKFINDKPVKKFIYVPQKLVNFVV